MLRASRTIPVILHVEDNEFDAFLLNRAFGKANVQVRLVRVVDGAEATLYLTGQGEYVDRVRYPLPDFLLLDLKMPRMGGFDVLRWMRSKPDFAAMPVIVLSSSDLPDDKALAMELGAKAYAVKDAGFREALEAANILLSTLGLIQPAAAA